MNPWQKARTRSGWQHGGLAEWTEGQTAYLSVVFSWKLAEAYQRAAWLRQMGYRVIAGGPAVEFNCFYLEDVAEYGVDYADAVARHNPSATFTSRGCIRNCRFCIVPVVEGPLIELDDWPVRPIICDNNLLACSRRHFDKVVDRLKPLSDIDFQGLDARLLTPYHAARLAELDVSVMRLAWDHIGLEDQFRKAWDLLKNAGFPARTIRVYVLIGYNDTPEDALYRLETVRNLGSWTCPMRYEPLDAVRRNSYVGPNWSEFELKRFMRYWANLRYTDSIPFSEFGIDGWQPENATQKTLL